MTVKYNYFEPNTKKSPDKECYLPMQSKNIVLFGHKNIVLFGHKNIVLFGHKIIFLFDKLAPNDVALVNIVDVHFCKKNYILAKKM